uniref:Uncharacterized protein n=1 Tax=Aegilops tauschii subsp. strangulata TaxID=200361 RepID=A0A453IY45_AEGTS
MDKLGQQNLSEISILSNSSIRYMNTARSPDDWAASYRCYTLDTS